MDRRDFLKLSGFLSAALVMPLNRLGKVLALPVEVASQGMLYRGTLDGKIYISADEGKNWQLHTNFGSAYSILGLTADDHSGDLLAQLGFDGRSFELALMAGTSVWRNL